MGKILIPDTFFEKIQKESGYEILLLQPAHIERYQMLPLLHRDPFDRMLIAQAQHEQLTLVTGDESIVQYDSVSILKVI